MGIREEIEAEIKAEQQRLASQKIEAKKQERLTNTGESNHQKFGCGITLFVAFIILIAIILSGIGGDSYDSNDWDFDGDVDVDDATKKLEWILENEK